VDRAGGALGQTVEKKKESFFPQNWVLQLRNKKLSAAQPKAY
jgi:hypothetical protein